MKLSECMKDIPYRSFSKMGDPDISGITDDSRCAGPGILFFGIRGTKQDGRRFLAEAERKGAVCVTDGVWSGAGRCLQVADTRRAYAACCQNFYEHPERFLVTVGVSGTKGKTSTTFLISSILQAAGRTCGLIGTEGIWIGTKQLAPAANTTPEPHSLFFWLKKMVEAGCTHVVIEISSQAMKQHRIGTLRFDYGVFTNFSEDHIGAGEHADLQEYLFWKQAFVYSCRQLVCRISEWRQFFFGRNRGFLPRTVCFGEKETPDCEYQLVRRGQKKEPFSGSSCWFSYLCGKGQRIQKFEIILSGEHQVWNGLAAFACTRQMGCSLAAQKKGLKTATVPGRGEVLCRGEITVLLDYAHNGASLEALLRSVRTEWTGPIWCLFGCGGNRAKSRRVQMGRISGALADLTILTEDNSRWEPVADILAQLEDGVQAAGGNCLVISDRETAIRQSIRSAPRGTLLILAGKGRETYLERRGEKIPFSDSETARNAFQSRKLRLRKKS